MPTPSATNVGAGGRPASSGPSSKSGGAVRRVKGSGSSTVSRSKPGAGGGGGNAGMWRFYTEDSPGLQVGPVPVLVMSLVFIASVFMLHIWGKWTRS